MVSRGDLERPLEGHRAADARLRKEELRRLASLSVNKARAEYDFLCRVWDASRGLGDGFSDGSWRATAQRPTLAAPSAPAEV